MGFQNIIKLLKSDERNLNFKCLKFKVFSGIIHVHNYIGSSFVVMHSILNLYRLNDKGHYSRHFSQFPDVKEDTEEELASSHLTKAPPTVLKRPSAHSTSKPKVSNPPTRKPHNSKKQSSDVKPVEGDRARQLKEKNKGKRANHDRKAMADKKRSRGMGAPPR